MVLSSSSTSSFGNSIKLPFASNCFKKGTELVSTATGNILASKEYFHDVRFTKDSSNVVLHGKESVVLLNSFDLELTNFSLEFSIKNHRNLRQIAFNSDTNTLAVWGEKKVTLVSI